MAWPARKSIGAVVVLLVLANIWVLSNKQTSKTFELSQGSEKQDGNSETAPMDEPSWDAAAPHDAPEKTDPLRGEQADVDSLKSDTEIAHPAANFSQPDYEAGMSLIKSVLDAVSQITPGVGNFTGKERYNRDIKSDGSTFGGQELPPTSTVLGMYLKVTDEEVEALKQSHAAVMKELPNSIPPNSAAGKGIVMTGGGKYLPMVLTAVHWIRENDKATPIEVFMADNTEYEAHICEELFPKLNVQCRVLRDIYGDALSDKLQSKYALKPLAILASKFDDIYFMDADSYPLKDVNLVFDWSIYRKRGYVLTSDYWARYISPKFYDVVGIKLGGRARGEPGDCLVQSDRENAVPGRSTDSGQIFVRKSSHIKSLLLAMYYNVFGPTVYFPLIMQNGQGEGDKDTYAAAAIVCNESYYQTQRGPATLGHTYMGNYKGYSMVQPDPISDYERFEEKRDVKESFFALHANSIKSNPKYLLQSHEERERGSPPLRQQRFFGHMGDVQRNLHENTDVELRLFRNMEAVVCEWAKTDGYRPRDWDGEDMSRMCRIVQKHVKWLKKNPKVAAPDVSPYWIDLED